MAGNTRTSAAARIAVIGAAVLAGTGAGWAQQAPVVAPMPPGGGTGGGLSGVVQPGGDEAAWSIARSTATMEAFRAYLSAYPNGAHAPEARALMGQLAAGTPVGGTLDTAVPPALPPAVEVPAGTSPADAAKAEASGKVIAGSGGASGSATENALGLSRDARRAIQSALTRLGYDTNGVDGAFGSGTRRAIRAWQQARGHAVTGYLNGAQAEELRVSGRAGGAESPATMQGAEAEAALNLTTTQRRIIQSRLTQLGYDTNGIDGKFGPGTRRAITAWQRARGAAATGFLTRADAEAIQNAGTSPVVVPGADADTAARAELALNMTREDRIAVQRALVRAGYDTRGVDGQFGSGTRRVIRAWQAGRGEPATGYLTRAQRDALVGGAPVVVGGKGASAADEAALNLGAVERTEVQTRLAALGYDPRGIDGRFGSGTRAAIRAWQGDNGLAVSGYLSSDQLSRLRNQRRN